MSATVRFYTIALSPNNVKVRLALGYKKIPFETVPVDPRDRAPVVQVSGQPLTPVLTHGQAVIYDSGAILRYLDANFAETPRLFDAGRDRMKEIEEWEHWARHEPSRAVNLVFQEAFAERQDPGSLEEARRLLHLAADRVESVVDRQSYLCGQALTAADLFVAPWIACGRLPAAVAEVFPPAHLFVEEFRLQGHDKTVQWLDRVMAHDPAP